MKSPYFRPSVTQRDGACISSVYARMTRAYTRIRRLKCAQRHAASQNLVLSRF
jgi:hypothetical protein